MSRIDPAPSRASAIALAAALCLATGGCASGSSASLTMAPLFFAESADAAGNILGDGGAPGAATPITAAATAAGAAAVLADMPRFIVAGGNADLPVALPGTGGALATSAVLGATSLTPGLAQSLAAGLSPTRALALLPGAAATVVAAAQSGIDLVGSTAIGSVQVHAGVGDGTIAAGATAALPAVVTPTLAAAPAVAAPVAAAAPAALAPVLAAAPAAVSPIVAVQAVVAPLVPVVAAPAVVMATAPIVAAPVVTAPMLTGAATVATTSIGTLLASPPAAGLVGGCALGCH